MNTLKRLFQWLNTPQPWPVSLVLFAAAATITAAGLLWLAWR